MGEDEGISTKHIHFDHSLSSSSNSDRSSYVDLFPRVSLQLRISWRS